MADGQLAAVKALAAQAGSGPAARQSLIASGAVPKLSKHLSSKTAAITSQSALALSLLGADPNTRPSVWEHQRALVPALVQALKTGGPLTQERSLATLAALIEHVPKAGAAVKNGIVPILRIAQTGSDALRSAAVSALDAFHVAVVWRAKRPADKHTFPALQHTRDLAEPLIRALSGGPEGAKLFTLGVLRVLEGQPKVAQALRRPAVTELLYEFAAAEDVDVAATSLEVLTFAFGPWNCPKEAAPQDAAYRASPTLCKLWETLPCRIHSRDPSKHALGLAAVRQTPEMEELCEALPLIISHLDPRPHPRPGGVLDDLDHIGHGTAKDPDVMWLAHHTCKKAFPSAGDDSSLRPTAKFTSRAELAEAAGLAMATLSAQPWGFQALRRTSVYTLAADLAKEKLLPRGLVEVLGRLFSCESPPDPQRLTLARSSLCDKFTEYLSACITGGPPKVVETARQALNWLTQFVAEHAADPEFPKGKGVEALLCAVCQCLLCAEAFAALWPAVEAGVNAILTQAGGFVAFLAVGGDQWATILIRESPVYIKMAAWRLLTTAVICGERNEGCVMLPFPTLEVIVGSALRPPAEPGSQEAMNLLCILTRSYDSGYEMFAFRDGACYHKPASAAHTSPESEGSGMGGSADGGEEAGDNSLTVPAEVAQSASRGGSADGGKDAGGELLTVPAELAQSASPGAVSAGGSSKDSIAPGNASESSGVIASGHSGKSEAASHTPEAPADLVAADLAQGTHADLAPHPPADLAPHPPVELAANPPADVAPHPPADLASHPPADVAANSSADLAPNPPADVAPHPPADLAPHPPADLAPHPPADLAPHPPADLAANPPADMAANPPADMAPNPPAEQAPYPPPDKVPNIPGGANAILSEMVRLGVAKAAITHFKSFPAPPAAGGDCRSSGLDQGAVAKFLCRLGWGTGDFSDLRDNGGLQIFVDLMRWGEGNEKIQGLEATALLAYTEPAARPPLRSVGAITPLAAQLEGASDMDIALVFLGLCVLLGDGTGRQPVPGAVDEVVATGAVPPLLRIMASGNENATSAFAVLPYIACEPCGVAAIVEADYAGPVVTALGLPFQFQFRNTSRSTSVVEENARVDVVRMIINIVEERLDQGQALLAAGLAPHLATIFSSPLDMVERKLAMQLVEKLSCHVPGACDVLVSAGVLAEVHRLAVATPDSADPGYAADVPGAEEEPLAYRTPQVVSEAEAVQASALLCGLAGYRGGVLEFASTDGEPVRYTESGYMSIPPESDTCQSPCDTRPRKTEDAVQKQPLARGGHASKKVCSMCGVVSEKHLKVCAVCRRARYCSHDCQVAHWPVHKAECRRWIPHG